MQLPEFVTTSLGRLAFEFARVQPLLPTYGHLILSSIFPIFTGAYSSLSRPSSAAKPQKVKKGVTDEDDGDEDDDEVPVKMESLSPSDAIMFPLLAGVTLTGLYFLIKWLEDPALLNKILNWYFATFSVFSVSRLVSDGLDVLHSFLFPHDFVDGGMLYHVNPKRKRAVPKDGPKELARFSPLPGIFSRLPLPQPLLDIFWTLHVLPTRKLTFSAFARGFGAADMKLGIHGLEGLAVGLTTVLYYNLVDKPWWLTNLMGFGFAYGALQLLSPTTFTTGTMLLGGLLCYDFYMVFRTPMMVTVAKSLDIPIKLLFPRPPDPGADPASKALSMLGLGDIVLPGIMIGLALRFDLYLFYLRKQRKVEDGTSESNIQKATYTPVSEAWGDYLWTFSFLPWFLLPTFTNSSPNSSTQYTARNAFPKPYFHAGMVGYVAGMVATLVAMQISDHPQPALIYLVPGVLTALWGTAVVRGEVKEMWGFSDAGEEEEDDKEEEKMDESVEKKRESETDKEIDVSLEKKDVDENKENVKEDIKVAKVDAKDDAVEDTPHKKQDTHNSLFNTSKHTETKKGSAKDEERAKKHDSNPRKLFSFAITAPPPFFITEAEAEAENAAIENGKGAKGTDQIKDVPTTPQKEGEHVEKRRRIQ